MLYVILPMAKSGLIGSGLVVLTFRQILRCQLFLVEELGFCGNAIYDQFFRTSDQGFGSSLAVLLIVIGSLLVWIIFMLVGAGTPALGAKDNEPASFPETIFLDTSRHLDHYSLHQHLLCLELP